jgi:hypothetical protein
VADALLDMASHGRDPDDFVNIARHTACGSRKDVLMMGGGTVLVTGASSGIGEASARALIGWHDQRGDRAVVDRWNDSCSPLSGGRGPPIRSSLSQP